MGRAEPEVSRNPEVLKEYSFLLRALVTTVPATGMLYLAASLVDENAPIMTEKNKAVCAMVAGLLSLPEAEPDLILRVLRNLP